MLTRAGLSPHWQGGKVDGGRIHRSDGRVCSVLPNEVGFASSQWLTRVFNQSVEL